MKKIMIITSSPNKDGLTAACGEAAREGSIKKGAEATLYNLNDYDIPSCQACNNAWGTCNKSYTCQVQNDFQALHNAVAEADAFIVVTPVYWGDLSESAKNFFDRLRRCEAGNREVNNLQDKPVICVAAAGGTGNGTITCLSTFERLFTHMRADKFDYISITRKSREYKLNTIRDAASAMVEYMEKGKAL